MPCFRGIELSVVTTSDRTVLPEFPHPDGSSARFLSPSKARKHRSAVFTSPRPWGKIDAGLSDDSQKADPKTSVYIPSAPDTNFFVKYSITQAPIGHKYLFFKVYMNGRHVVSWGINASETTSGATHQALFEPLGYYDDNGVVVREPGIESRGFRFVSSTAGLRSVADDGGLIEVQVFRAKARNRRAPRPDPYRGGDKYGIALVSNGLLDRPHMASYYDYLLADARDSPYATFCFHYRSWDNLRLLQLARPAESVKALTSSEDSACSTTMDHILGLGVEDIHAHQADGTFAVPATSRSLPEPPRPHGSAEDDDSNTENACSLRDQPECKISEEFHVRRRAVSAVSKASVTPSLWEYADGTEGFAVDTLELGLARKLETIFCGRLSEQSSLVSPEEDGEEEEGSVVTQPNSDDVFRPAADETVGQELAEEDNDTRVSGKELLMFPHFTDSLRKRDLASNPSPQVYRRGSSDGISPRSRGSPQLRRHHCSLDSFPQLVPSLGTETVDKSSVRTVSEDSKSGGKSRRSRSSSRAHRHRHTALRVEEWAMECAKEAGLQKEE